MMLTLKKVLTNNWSFPILLLIPLIALSVFKISGTSAGAMHNILYGASKTDPALIAGQPRDIRSDEWLVGVQQIVAQSKSNFPRINENIGLGQDVSTQDVPYRDWSMLFKPHNLGFFILPLEIAFALKWWLMAYLLLVSCYFFVLALLPDRRLLAIGLSFGLLFSAFVQWWYTYGTLGSLYYSLFLATIFIHLLKQKDMRKKVGWGVLFSFVLACFGLVLYPPFQIACGLVLAAFMAGYALQNYAHIGKKTFWQGILVIGGAGVVSILVAGLFVFTRLEVVKTIGSTAYPGVRVIKSGGTSGNHFLASHLGYQFVSDKHAAHYLIDDKDISNQSETSNFLLLLPFLFLPVMVLTYQDWRKKRAVDWPLVALMALFVIFLFELFVPAFTPISRLFLLDKVGPGRVLIGIGLMNIMALVLVIRNLADRKKFSISPLVAGIYSLAVLAIELYVSLHAHYSFGTFIGPKRAVLFSLPIPLIIYFLLRKRFAIAVAIFCGFSVFMSFGVNPLYRGLDIVTDNPISKAVMEYGANSDKRWATEGGYLENVATINDEPSLSSVYNYPQFELWEVVPQAQKNNYNRYAHVGIQVSDDTSQPTQLVLITPDSFVVRTNSCSDYLKRFDVGYVLTASVLKNGCLSLQKTLSFPRTTLYIYRVTN